MLCSVTGQCVKPTNMFSLIKLPCLVDLTSLITFNGKIPLTFTAHFEIAISNNFLPSIFNLKLLSNTVGIQILD